MTAPLAHRPPSHDPTATPTAWADRILRVLDHVHGHLDQELDPAALAALAGFSRHHFHRVFRGMVGESVMGYVRRLRLERAAFRLRHDGGELLPLALAHGYDSHEAFTRAFRAHFGMPPSAWRERARSAEAGLAAERRVEPARRLLVCRWVGPYDACRPAWERLLGAVARAPGAWVPGPTIGLVYDDPEITPSERCRYDAAVLLADGALRDAARPDGPLPDGAIPGVSDAGLALRTLPAGTWAVALHVGAYASILDTYVALLGGWLPRQRVELADAPVVERYLTAPGSVPDAELRTEVCVRLA